MQREEIDNHVTFGCKLLNESTDIPVYVFDSSNHCALEYGSIEKINPKYSVIEDFLISLPKEISPQGLPIIHTTNNLERVVVLPYRSLSIYLGPTLFPKPTRSGIDEIVTTIGLSQNKKEFEEYYYSLPVISTWKLVNASILLFYVLHQKRVDVKDVILENNQLEIRNFKQVNPNQSLIDLRQNSFFHQDPSHEKRVFKYISEGRKEELLLYWKPFKEDGEFEAILSKKSELRNQKNHAIASITLATRAAIEGGLHSEIAYTMGDMQIQELEEINNVRDVRTYTEYCLCEFAEKVAKERKQRYSKTIRECQDYIFNHIYDEISLSIVADYLSINAKYLSNLFKKEVGISITAYIQQIKIEEAIKLISFSDYSLSEIQALLNFTDQSYFTKVFKKHTGVTPKQFIQNNSTI